MVIPATAMFDLRTILLDVIVFVCLSRRLCVLAAIHYNCETGLATLDDVSKGLANTSILHDGESGWISGFADLSTVLEFEGCLDPYIVKVKRSKKVSRPKGNILNACVHHCSDTEYDFFGVEGDTCNCFETNVAEQLIAKIKMESSSCLMSCETIFSSSCDRFLLVYRYVKQHIKIHGGGQCIFAISTSWRSDSPFRYYASSCYNNMLVNHNICQNMNKCDNGTRVNSHICRFYSHYRSMMGALAQCFKYDGFLISFDNKKELEYLVGSNTRNHWVNAFRVINPVEQKQNSCLAIRRRNSTFLLESESCSFSKVPICKLDNMEQYMITQQDQNNNIQIPLLVGTNVGSVLIIVSVIVSIVIYRRRRQDRSENHLLQDTHSVDTQQHVTNSPNIHHRSHRADVQNGNTEQNKSYVSDSQNHVYDQIDERATATNTAYITPCISTEQVIMTSSDSHCNKTLDQRNSKHYVDQITKTPALKDKMDEQHQHYREENKAHTNVEAKLTGDYPCIDLLDDKESMITSLDDKRHETYSQGYSNTIDVDDMNYLNVHGDVTSGRTLPHNADTQTGYTDLRGQESLDEQKYTELDIAVNATTTINTDGKELEYDYVDMERK